MSGKLLSLKDGCLNTIVGNLEVFMHANDLAASPYLKRLFLFLQRRYSMEILTRVSEEGIMKDEYLSFLLNESLASINLELFTECSWQEVKNRICEIGDSVTEFIVPNSWGLKLKDDIEEVLKSLKNVQVLHLGTSTLSDELLKTIVKNCPLLKDLDLSRSRITDTGLEYLCGFNNEKSNLQCLSLQKLDATNTNVTTMGLAFVLQSIPTLQELQCESLPDVLMTVYENYSMNELKKHFNLTNLVFDPTDLENSAYSPEKYLSVCIELCPNINFLRVEHLSQASELLLCSKLENLNHVDLSLAHRLEMNADNFLISQGSRIRNLTLTNFEITLSAILNNCFRLQQLKLVHVKVIDSDTSSPHSFNCLNSLSLDIFNSEGSNKKFVTTMLKLATNLKALELYKCSIDDKVGEEIMKNSCLTKIDLSDSDITLVLLLKIVECCPSLKILNISSSSILSYEDCDTLITICLSNGKNICISVDNVDDDFSSVSNASSYSYDFEDDYDDGIYYDSDFEFDSEGESY